MLFNLVKVKTKYPQQILILRWQEGIKIFVVVTFFIRKIFLFSRIFRKEQSLW